MITMAFGENSIKKLRRNFGATASNMTGNPLNDVCSRRPLTKWLTINVVTCAGCIQNKPVIDKDQKISSNFLYCPLFVAKYHIFQDSQSPPAHIICFFPKAKIPFEREEISDCEWD